MTAGRLSIRRTDDTDLVRELHAETFPADPWEDDLDIEHWLVTLDDEPVGFCSAILIGDDANILYLTRAGVLPAARGAGLQQKMIKARLTWAKRQGAEIAITYTVPDNWPSITNLIRAGFRFYDPEYAWAGRKMFYFRKAL